MNRTSIAVALGATIAVAAVGQAQAQAKPPAPTPIRGASGPPTVFVDGSGTVNVIWSANGAGGLARTHYARKPKGASKFTEVTLPNMPSTSGQFIYSPGAGKLEVIATVNGPLTLAGWISDNDGVSWTQLPGTALTASFGAEGVYLSATQLWQAPGGPIQYAGNDGDQGPIVQLSSDLSTATTIATDTSAITPEQLARSGSGTIYIVGGPVDEYTQPGTFPFQAGSATGTISFPCQGNGLTSMAMTAGATQAVVAFSGCGRTWTRTLGPTGEVGPLVTLGGSPVIEAGHSRNGTPWVGLSTAPGGGITVAFSVEGDDVQVAHSATGATWKPAAGFVPDVLGATVAATMNRSLAQGAGGYLGVQGDFGDNHERAAVVSLAGTYRTPKPPSSAGIAGPVHGTLGSTAVTAQGRVSRRAFAKAGQAQLRIVDAIGGAETISMGVSRTTRTQSIDLCSGSTRLKLTPGHARTVTVPCGTSSVVIGGTASPGIATRRGDVVTYTIQGRNGTLTLTGKIQ